MGAVVGALTIVCLETTRLVKQAYVMFHKNA